jgi:hypothetical protein
MARDSAIDFSIDQAQKLFGKGIEVIGRRTGIESLYNYGREVVEQQEEDIRKGNYQPEYTMGLREAYTQGGISKALGWLGEKTQENLATSAPALVGTLTAALTAPFSVPAAALIGGATIVGSGVMGTGEVAEEMEQKTGNYDDAVAIGAGTIIGLLDRFGAGKVIPKDELLTMTGKQLIRALGKEGKVDAAREIGKRIGKSVAFEGVTEGAQEGVSVGATALTGGEYTGLEVADKILEGTVLGGTMGGGITTGIETLRQGPGAVNKIQDMFSGGPGTGGFSPEMAFAGSLFSPERAQLRQVPLTTSEILMNQGPSDQGSSPSQKINEATERNLQAATDEEADPKQNFFNQDMTGESTKDNPTVSPLRIILNNLKKQNEGVRKTGKDIIGDLRAAEKGNQGLVGFMGNYDTRVTEVKEKKAVPAEGVDGKAFGKAMKEAKGDYTKLDPSLYILKDFVKPSREVVLSFNDNLSGTSDSVTHNRGGEAYNSGLEEYLVRNKDKELTYDDVIKVFDQTRPQVKLEIRSKAAGQNPTGLLVNANNPQAGNTLDLSNVVGGVALESTQRIMQNFVDESGGRVSNPKDFEVDSVAIVSYDDNKQNIKSGTLENSGTLESAREKNTAGNEVIEDRVFDLKIGAGHDYHGKGAAYLRGMVVRREEDGKLYMMAEEVQDDSSRIKEENLDVATPMYDLDSPDQTLEKTWTERMELAKLGQVPPTQEQQIFDEDSQNYEDFFGESAPEEYDPRPSENRRPAAIHSFMGDLGRDADGNEIPRAGNYRPGSSRNIFDSSEKLKIIALDEIEQEIPMEDSLTQLRKDRQEAYQKYESDREVYNDEEEKLDKLSDELREREDFLIFPNQVIDVTEMALDDMVNNRFEITGAINSKIKDRAPFFGRDPNENFYDLLAGSSNFTDTDVNPIGPIVENVFIELQKQGKLKTPLSYDQRSMTNSEKDFKLTAKTPNEILVKEKNFGSLESEEVNPVFNVLHDMPGRVGSYGSMTILRLGSSKGIIPRDILQSLPKNYFEEMQNRTSKPEAFRKTIDMVMNESINNQANRVLNARVAKYILDNHIKSRKSSENVMPETDIDELIISNYTPEGQMMAARPNNSPLQNLQENRVDLKGFVEDFNNRLGPKAVLDIKEYIGRELDSMNSKIGFIPVRDIMTSENMSDDALIEKYKQSMLSDSSSYNSFVQYLLKEPYVNSVKATPANMNPLFESVDALDKNVSKLRDKYMASFAEARKLASKKEKERRSQAFELAITKRAKEFGYQPQELYNAYRRLDTHILNTEPYMRDSAHSSQAQASRAIIKGAINQIPNLEKIYGEPVVGFVFPARTDLQNMSGRARLPADDGSARYLAALAKHKKAGLTSYEVAPNIVKKQFQDALLDEAGNPQVQVEENVMFNMVDKNGNRKARLPNPVQYILRLDPGSTGEKLAKSKFVFKAKGGTVDLRKVG